MSYWSFFDEHFGFNAGQTVAIMGAHSLGVARPEDSGYEGLGGWVPDIFLLGMFFSQFVSMIPCQRCLLIPFPYYMTRQ